MIAPLARADNARRVDCCHGWSEPDGCTGIGSASWKELSHRVRFARLSARNRCRSNLQILWPKGKLSSPVQP
jgi:hypothetical protein